MEEIKTCSRCKEVKPRSKFYRRRKSKDGLMHICRSCSYIKNKEWRAKNPDKFKEICNRYWKNSKSKALISRTPENTSKYKRKTRYGITPKQIDMLLKDQDRSCAICGTKFKNNKFHVDHCHSTKIVRGLLCKGCNQGIGLLKDDIGLMKSAIKYLKAKPLLSLQTSFDI